MLLLFPQHAAALLEKFALLEKKKRERHIQGRRQVPTELASTADCLVQGARANEYLRSKAAAIRLVTEKLVR